MQSIAQVHDANIIYCKLLPLPRYPDHARDSMHKAMNTKTAPLPYVFFL